MPGSPTRLKAALSGAVFGLGMPAFQSWQSVLLLSDAARRLAFAAALAVLFFAPVMLFVVGTQHLQYGRTDPGRAQFRASLLQVGARFLCWLVGTALAFGLLAAWRLWRQVA